MLGWVLLVGGLLFASGGDAHILDMPYRSQLDGSPYALANCGPTSLSMALAYYGIDASPWELRVRAMKAQHSWITDDGGYSDRYGVFVYHLATVAEQLGLHANGLWTREGGHTDRLHQWQANELRREVQADHPVIVEVEYRALPSHAGSIAIDDHYIVVYGTVGSDFVYDDPLGIADRGHDELISERDLIAAMSESSVPRAGFAVVKPTS
jgi:Peptidase_C39 like family